MVKKSGFTLVELLVVIAIIGMLVALLLPAVQQARESARVMQCSNALKNMSLAVLNYEAALKAFPSNGWNWYWVGDPDRSGPTQTGSWAYSILPYIEQDALYQLGADSQPDVITSTQKSGAKTREGTPLSVFICPSRRACMTYPLGKHAPVNADTMTASTSPSSASQVVKSDYAANSGALGFQVSHTPSSTSGFPNASFTNIDKLCDGITHARSAVGRRKISDGASNTYLIGEKYINPDAYSTGQDGGDNQSFYAGHDCDSVRWTYGPSTPSQYAVRRDRSGVNYSYAYGASHAGTFGMSLCDGSAHRMSYKVDAIIHRNLGSRNDGDSKFPEE